MMKLTKPLENQARNHSTLCVVLLACLGLFSCLPAATEVGRIDTQYPVTQSFQVRTEAALTARQPIDVNTVDVRQRYLGQPGYVVPPGAVVRRISVDDPRAARVSLLDKVDHSSHPWVFVDVLQSPLEKQIGQSGWVHVSHLTRDDSAEIIQAPPWRTDLLASAAYLCARPERAPEPGKVCALPVHPSLKLRFLECQANFAKVEVWDPEGKYAVGFVRVDAFKSSPCP